jgi:hypothetical protein
MGFLWRCGFCGFNVRLSGGSSLQSLLLSDLSRWKFIHALLLPFTAFTVGVHSRSHLALVNWICDPLSHHGGPLSGRRIAPSDASLVSALEERCGFCLQPWPVCWLAWWVGSCCVGVGTGGVRCAGRR